jgi:hypothetical protein
MSNAGRSLQMAVKTNNCRFRFKIQNSLTDRSWSHAHGQIFPKQVNKQVRKATTYQSTKQVRKHSKPSCYKA